jgi:hypothetical protein
MVCSMDESALLLAVGRVAEAIDRLEADYRAGRTAARLAGLTAGRQGGRQSADSSDLEARIAEIWAMVREIDPQISRLASRYADPSS